MSPSFNLNVKLGRRSEADVVGLDIQPGLVAAVQARVNGSILAERVALAPLPSETVREGDVVDEVVLSDTLRELFAGSRLSKRVRVGVANQRTVMRTIELPPVTDRKELAAAVGFQAQDQVPMPLASAVLDFHPLGIVETPAGPRQRVVLVAAQRDMIDRLLAAVRRAGLRAEGIDLSAFALIRSLYRRDEEHLGRVLYLNVDGLTNVAIAEGTVCRFTRVLGGGLEEMAGELAERRSIPLADARELLANFDLTAPPAEAASTADPPSPASSAALAEHPDVEHHAQGAAAPNVEQAPVEQGSAEQLSDDPAPTPENSSDEDMRAVLESGIREISGEVRNSLEFHRSQDGGGEVSRVVLSGSALGLRGFAEALEQSLGVKVHCESVGLAEASNADELSTHRLAIAAGLAAREVPS